MIQQGTVDYTAIHFSKTYPVVETPCGRTGPSADRWGYVTCLGCLKAGAHLDPRINARWEALKAEAEQGVSG